MYTQNYVRNANLFYRSYEDEIRAGKSNILTAKISEKYKGIQKRVGIEEYIYLNKKLV